MFRALAILAGLLASACTDNNGPATPDATISDAARPIDRGDGAFSCPQDAVRRAGRHRLFMQGHGATPDQDNVYPMLHEWGDDGSDAKLCDDSIFVDDENGDGVWQPGEDPLPLGPDALVHGEHFLVGPGAFAEFSTTLCEDITGDISFYIPNFDVSGSEARHELFVVHEGEEFLIGDAIDAEAGMSGYNPFIRQISGNDPDVVPGDQLLLRSTNLNGYQFSVMIWNPPSEYESWILVEVP